MKKNVSIEKRKTFRHGDLRNALVTAGLEEQVLHLLRIEHDREAADAGDVLSWLHNGPAVGCYGL